MISMDMHDIKLFLNLVRPDLGETYVDNLVNFLLWHLEDKIRKEVLNIETEVHTDFFTLPNPYDDVYWWYVFSFLDLMEGKMDRYQESYKQFELAWDNLCRHVFTEKENFKLNERFLEEQECLCG